MKGSQGWSGMTEEYKGWLKIFRGTQGCPMMVWS